MDLQALTAEPRQGLRKVLRGAGISLRAASRHLGRSEPHVGRVLAGLYPLYVSDLMELLSLARFSAWDFFDLHYPFGGQKMFELRRGEKAPWIPRGRIATHQPRPSDPQGPAEWVEVIRDLLKDKIRDSPFSQRAVSRTLGLPQDALGLALRANTRLRLAHVLGTLQVIGVSPGRFFMEIYAPGESLPARLQWSQVLTEMERALALVAEGPPPGRRGRRAPRPEGRPEKPEE